MMWRKIELKDDVAVDNAVKGKDTFTLPTGHAISDLLLTVRAKNESDHNAPNATEAKTVINSVSEIAIEAGSRTFKKYSADIALKWATYRDGIEPYTNLTQALGGTYPSGWQEVFIPINFSRPIGNDRVCALPAPLYKDGGLSLSLTYDFPVDDDSGQNAFLTGAANHRYDLYANILPHLHENTLSGLKVIEQTKKRQYTTKATGAEYLDMTIDQSGRQVMAYLIDAYKTGVREGALLEKLELLIGSNTIMENDWQAIQWENAANCNLEYQRRVDMKAQTTDDEYRCKVPNVQPFYQPYVTTSEDAVITNTGDKVTISGQTADDQGMLFLNSDVIPCTAILDFNKDHSLRHLLSMAHDKIQIKVENKTASGTAEFHEMILAPAVY